MGFRDEGLIRRYNRLVVAAEDFAFLPLHWQLSDVLRLSLASIPATSWRSAPKHRVGVLRMSSHVRHIRTTNILIEAIHAILEVSRVLIIPQR